MAIHAVYLDDEAYTEAERLFGSNCRQEYQVWAKHPHDLAIRSESDPEAFLRQLTLGKVRPDAVILDVDFNAFPGDTLKVADPPVTADKSNWGLVLLKTIKRIDPDLPVLILTSLPGQILSFEAGRFGADDFMSKTAFVSAREHAIQALSERLHRAVAACRERAVYDHAHLETANDFAKDYDRVERSSFATVAYYHYENNLIESAVTELLAEAKEGRRLRILDVGCGTGRIERMLASLECRGRLEVAAVDFSGSMLIQAEKSLGALSGCKVTLGSRADEDADSVLQVSLYRAPAEHLTFLQSRYPEGFDFIVLGFGLLSYVTYSKVIVASPMKAADTGLFPLLRPGGRLLFSVYNEDSLLYDRIAKLDYQDEEIPIAAVMDLNEGKLRVSGDRCFACDAFTVKRVSRFLRQGGLTVDPQEVSTFPTLLLTMCNSDASQMPVDPIFEPGVFSPEFFRLDCDVSKTVLGRGHYIVGIASRP